MPGQLSFDEVEPFVRRIVRWRLGATVPVQDLEDITGDVLLQLLTRLEGEPIADLEAYAATAAHHGCDRYLRARFPQRSRLATRVGYLVENSPLYATWQERESLVCGLRSQRGQAARTDLAPGWSQVSLSANPDEARTVAAVFAWTKAPLRLPDLCDAVASLLNVRDGVTSASELHLAAETPDVDHVLIQRQTLEQLWGEIVQLPQPQRCALLLNLQDVASLPSTGVASIRAIAAALELPAERLAELWRDLPLSDLAIASMLGLTRQQVINLRKSSRERLSRRMAGNIDPSSGSKSVKGQNV